MWADNIHREPDNVWQGFFFALGLFIMLESLVFTVVDGLKWTNLLLPLTFVLAMSVFLAQLRLTFHRLTFHLYLLNLFVGAIAILYFVHSLFYLQPITDPSWLYLLYQDVLVSLRNLSNEKIFAPEQIGLYTLLVLSIIGFLANYFLNLLVKEGKIIGLLILGLGFQGFFFSYVKRSFSGANFVFMFVGLVLLSALRRSEQQQKWKRNGARHTEEVAFSWMAKSLLYIGLIVGIAAGLPAIKATLVQDNPRFQSFATQMSGVSPDAVENGLSEITTSFSWSDSKLGGPWEQSSTYVMSITSDYGAYWRGGAKDIYTGSGWEEGSGESTPLAAEYSDKIYRGIKTTKAEQTVRMGGSFTVSPVVFGATMPVQVSGMTNIHRNFNDNLLIRGDLKGSTIYKVVSEIPVLDSESIELLRKSGNNYPEEIRWRYLALPKVPQRVIDLAKQITEEKTNPYDKAQSLVDYFQKNDDYVYDLNPSKVPLGRDFVDYFLETQKGYCTYYSTAMAIMARAIGLPSRWVSGYSMGESNEKTSNTYKITSADMHAWVEIYFNGIGWIPFEPTKSFSLPRIGGSQPPSQQEVEKTPPLTPNSQRAIELKFGYIIAIIALGLVILFIIYLSLKKLKGNLVTVNNLRPRLRNHRRSIINNYLSFLKFMAKAGRRRAPGQTAREFALSLGKHFNSLAGSLLNFTDSFEQARYSKRPVTNTWVEQVEAELETLKAGIKEYEQNE